MKNKIEYDDIDKFLNLEKELITINELIEILVEYPFNLS